MFFFWTADDDGHRPSPPTRTSASRTTDWKVKYSPQKEEETYRREPWRGGQVGNLHRNLNVADLFLVIKFNIYLFCRLQLFVQ